MNVQYKYSKVHVTAFCNSQEEHVQGYRHKIHVGKSQHDISKSLKSPVVKIECESHSGGSCLFIQISTFSFFFGGTFNWRDRMCKVKI